MLCWHFSALNQKAAYLHCIYFDLSFFLLKIGFTCVHYECIV